MALPPLPTHLLVAVDDESSDTSAHTPMVVMVTVRMHRPNAAEERRAAMRRLIQMSMRV